MAETSGTPGGTWSRQGEMSRRQLLRGGLLGGAAIGAGVILEACGSSPKASPKKSPVTTKKPKRGGTLRAGLSGGTSADTVLPLNPLNETDYARVFQLYDSLVVHDRQALPVLSLAEEVTPNKDATSFTVRLRKGVTFHNGRDLTADDVIYTFQQILNPKSPAAGASAMSFVDAPGMKKLDKLTVRVPCSRPFASFYDTLPLYYYSIIPADFDPKHPVGTGPFKFKSFTPGVESVFTRNGSYWQDGLPYVDEVIISDYPDETTQINALVAGQLDVVNLLSADAIAPVQSGGAAVVISDSGGWTPFTMRVDQPPFNDPLVRQAFRLIVDRPAMMEIIFEGHGTLGNDVFGIFDPAYDRSLPQRHQDIDQAKSLLRRAGHDGLAVSITTGNIAQGTLKAAEMFKQQALAAGVTVNLNQVTATDFFGPQYLQWVFAQDFWGYYGYLPQVGFATLPKSPYNETHWGDPHYIALYEKALATVDDSKRYEVAHELQKIDYDSGGYIIPYFPPLIDGHRTRVHGVAPARTGRPLFNYDFKILWVD
ncbi:MAG: ABC transporter substrate-binding protein [Acidimicrobiales bacterium]